MSRTPAGHGDGDPGHLQVSRRETVARSARVGGPRRSIFRTEAAGESAGEVVGRRAAQLLEAGLPAELGAQQDLAVRGADGLPGVAVHVQRRVVVEEPGRVAGDRREISRGVGVGGHQSAGCGSPGLLRNQRRDPQAASPSQRSGTWSGRRQGRSDVAWEGIARIAHARHRPVPHHTVNHRTAAPATTSPPATAGPLRSPPWAALSRADEPPGVGRANRGGEVIARAGCRLAPRAMLVAGRTGRLVLPCAG